MADYELLQQEVPTPAPAPSRWHIRLRNILITILALYGLLHLFYQLITHIPTFKSSTNPCACGRTPSEAATSGCKFDPFAMAWLPDRCRDDELIAEFTALGETYNHSWELYTYPDPKTQLSLEDVSMMAQVVGTEAHGKVRVTTTADWHHTHCLYIMRKIYRARAAARMVEPRMDNEEHVKHCVESVLEWVRSRSDVSGLMGASVVDLYAD